MHAIYTRAPDLSRYRRRRRQVPFHHHFPGPTLSTGHTFLLPSRLLLDGRAQDAPTHATPALLVSSKRHCIFCDPSTFGKPRRRTKLVFAKVDSWSNRAGFKRSTTAPRIGSRTTLRRGRQCAQSFPKFLLASPSFHGGRGALPSAGGHPSDLTYLAGGGAAEA